MFLTDRSRQIAYKDCNRMRYWLTEYGGRGIVSEEISNDLVIGLGDHAAVEKMLLGLPIIEGVRAGLDRIPKNIDPARSRYLHGVIAGMAWAFGLGWLPKLLSQYEVRAVEKEAIRELAPGILHMSRTDAELFHKIERVNVLFSLKTATRKDERLFKEHKHDVQGLSEAWASGKTFEHIQMLYILKGFKKNGLFQSVLFWKGNEDKPTYGDLVWPLKGSREQGIEATRRHMIELGLATLEAQFVQPPLIHRNPKHIERWVRQAKGQEDRVRYCSEEVGKFEIGSIEWEEALDYYFTMNEKRCHWPADCAFLAMCHDGKSDATPEEIIQNPLENGFVFRTPHHEEEVKKWLKKTKKRRR